jgi:hypothetical protein
VALSIVRRNDARVLTTRTSPRDGLYALASAWQASTSGNVRRFERPEAPASSDANQSTEAAAEPPYWPDGPSAA